MVNGGGFADREVVILGHSYGGYAAISVARNLIAHGVNVRALITVDSFSPNKFRPSSLFGNRQEREPLGFGSFPPELSMNFSRFMYDPNIASINNDENVFLKDWLSAGLPLWINFYQNRPVRNVLFTGPIPVNEDTGLPINIPSNSHHINMAVNESRIWQELEIILK
jgi:pimeloyl-ACP methyl ester carboxylesterase